MLRKITLAAASGVAVAGLSAVAVAQAAEPRLDRVQLPSERIERTMKTHSEALRYRDLLAEAKKLDAEPKRNALAAQRPTFVKLDQANEDLRERVEKARKAEPSASDFALAAGVSQATLDAIAGCESGGDPAAVNPAGYYGKYQFDQGTWASVGGSGNPAEASEAEQDHRASLLYARAGSSPWPVCGQ